MTPERPRRVLVTGVSHYLGGELVHRLEERDDVEAIFGLDIADPTVAFDRAEFVHADTRHSVIAKLVRELQLETVVHCAVLVDAASSPRVIHETDVIGTMNLLAACAGDGSPVRRLVVKSSVAVYGHRVEDPSFLGEELTRGRLPSTSLGRDLAELEQLVRDFAVRNPRVAVTALRLAHQLGVRDPGPLGAYFRVARVPMVAGFDPCLQLLHEEDAVEALYRAAVADHPGTFNVAGGGVLLLSQAIALMGGQAWPVLPPLGLMAGQLAARAAAGLHLGAHLVELITHGRVVDCARLGDEFGWRPGYSTREVVTDFAARSAGPEGEPPPVPQELELQAYLRRRRRAGLELTN